MTRRRRPLPLAACLVALAALAGCAATPATTGVRALLVEPADPAWTTRYWGLRQIDAVTAWQRVPDASRAIIAVVDSGLAPHPDIVRPQLLPGHNQCPAGTPDPDENGHGTKVAGVIAGRRDGGQAVGVAWNAEVRPYKILCPAGLVQERAVAGLRAALAAAPPPHIVNASWPALPAAVASEIDQLVTAHPGVLFVFAAPPAGPYPAFTTRPNVLVVTAADRNDELPRWAGRDPAAVHLAAPGVAIATADIGGGTTVFQGASAGAAFVSGCAALVKLAARDPAAMTGAMIRDHLVGGAAPKPGLTGGVTGGRRLDCGRAVSSVPR